MAFEVFDDVAFFWFVEIFLVTILLPFTLHAVWLLYSTLRSSKQALKETDSNCPSKCDCVKCIAKRARELRKARDNKSLCRRVFSIKWIVFISLWLLLGLVHLNIADMEDQQFVVFDPYEILGVEQGAGFSDIRKAYRVMSLKWHPDKNPGNSDAEQKFILLTKAYKTLTDEATRENYEKYGNPDGYHGTSVTIGLPSFMSRRENELTILLAYFLLLIIILPTIVCCWWRRAMSYHQSGIHQRSIQIYAHLIGENLSVKYLIEVLAASHEYETLLKTHPVDEAELKRLFLAVKDKWMKQKLSVPYIVAGSVLLHAYMLRESIPPCLQPQLRFLLKDAHRLINFMTELCLARQFLKPAMACIELSQLITQAMWPFDSSLLQIPFLNQKDLRLLAKKSVKDIMQFKALSKDTLLQLFDRAHTPDEINDMHFVASMIPDIEVKCNHEVRDEDEIFPDDLVTIFIEITRVDLGEDEESKTELSLQDKLTNENDTADSTKIEEISPFRQTDDVNKMDTNTTVIEASTNPDQTDSPDQVVSTLSESSEDEDYETVDRDLFEDVSWPEVHSSNTRQPIDDDLDLVHSSFYPFEKRQNWILFLVDRKLNKLVSQHIRLDGLGRSQVTQMYVRAGPPGTYIYDLYVLCDSYIRIDKKVSYKLHVSKPAKDEKIVVEDRGIFDDDIDEDVDDEEEEEGKWYYLGSSNFVEMLLTLAILGVFGMFAFNYLHSKGWWEAYIEPFLGRVGVIISPAFSWLYSRVMGNQSS